jgi:DNA-binding transcriptional LysR family regulator
MEDHQRQDDEAQGMAGKQHIGHRYAGDEALFRAAEHDRYSVPAQEAQAAGRESGDRQHRGQQPALGLSQGILEASERARRYFAGSELRGRVRFGASEDFVQSRLPEVLREFTRVHRAVDLELTVGLSGGLLETLDAGELDLVLAKRRPGEDRGQLVRREKLVWLGSDPALADPDRPLPLILYPPPSISRAIALEVLERTGRSWRIVCTSSSFSGLNAAALAGLGITVQGDGFVPAGLTLLPGLPDLGRIELVIAGPGRTLRGPADSLATAILENAYRL